MIRIPIAVTFLIVAAAAGTAWHSHQRLAGLRNEHEKLLALAAKHQIAFDPYHPAKPAHVTKRPRPDRVAEAKQAAAALISYTGDLRVMKLQTLPDAATRQRMIDQMDEAMALGGDQLKILITELRSGWTPDDRERGSLLYFALERLILDHPQDALAIMTDSAEMRELIGQHTNSLTKNGVFSAVRNWASTDLESAARWVREFEKSKEITGRLTPARTALIFSAAEYDPAKCIGLIKEFQADPKAMAETFAQWVESPRQRLAFLAVLREWQARLAGETDRSPVFNRAIRSLAFGERYGEKPGFDFTTRWIDTATLSLQEIEVQTQDLQDHIITDETAKWIDWLGSKLPPDTARDRVWPLVTNWVERDYQAAGKWLTKAADGPIKHTAARAFAEAIFPHDRQTAIQWALSVPAGDDRDKTLKQLHSAWPKEDPGGAVAFAKKHGIE